jgi:NADH dehydrogenase FAD-containing subunit
VAVLADCTLPGHPEVFVIGDLMSLNHLPGVAEVAMQSGRHAAHTIVRRLRGDDTTHEFRYRDLGTMATVSRFRAVAWFGSVRLGGPWPGCSGSSYTWHSSPASRIEWPRWPAGPSRSSAAAGPSARSPSSRSLPEHAASAVRIIQTA